MYQQTTLIGNLGSDVELRYLPNGTPVANFSFAVNRSWTGQDGQRQEKTTWFRITVWRKQAEVVAQYLHKGSRVLITGEIEEASAWMDQEGNPRASIEITAREVKFMDTRNDNSQGMNNQQAQPQYAPAEPEMATEDIPF